MVGDAGLGTFHPGITVISKTLRYYSACALFVVVIIFFFFRELSCDENEMSAGKYLIF